jgi:heme-degrading monooxygenase HmoA
VARATGQPGQADEATRYAREQVVPAWQKLAGFKGAYVLMDRQSGKSMPITLWDTEESAKTADAAMAPVAAQAKQQFNLSSMPATEFYEVAVEERGATASQAGKVARVVAGQVPQHLVNPEFIERMTQQFREQLVPALRRQAGFSGMYLLRDAESGRGLTISLWDSDEHARAATEATTAQRTQAVRDAGMPSVSEGEYYEVTVQV